MFKTRLDSKNVFKNDENVPVRINDALDELIEESLIMGMRQRTADDYRRHVTKLCEVNKINYMNELNRECILKYLQYNDVKQSTKRVRFKAIRSVLNKWFDKGLIEVKFWNNIRIRVDEEIKTGTTEREFYILLSCLDLSQFTQLRDACIYLLIWETGVRFGTFSELTESMIDYDSKIVKFRGSAMKNRKALSLPISDTLIDLLKALIETNSEVLKANGKESDLVFLTLNGNGLRYNSMNKRTAHYREKFGIYNITPHDLRRGFAKRLLNKGVSIPIISKALNHSDLSVTTKYLHISNQEVIDSLRDL